MKRILFGCLPILSGAIGCLFYRGIATLTGNKLGAFSIAIGISLGLYSLLAIITIVNDR